MADESTLGIPFLTGILVLISLFIAWYRSWNPLLDAIPTIGYSDPLLSYLTAFRYNFFDGIPIVKEGYEKSKPGLFKIPMFRRWMVLPTNVQLIEDVKKAPDDVLSMTESVREFLQTDYTFGALDREDTYDRRVISSKLTRNIAATFEQANDEIVEALRECIPIDSEEWVKISVLPTAQRIICRASNRIFVGVPLCRNRDYQKLAITFTVNVVKLANKLAMFPKPLKPIAARILSNLPSKVQQMTEFIKPKVNERFAKMEDLGDTWNDAPNDMLMGLMSEAKGVERSLEGLARRMLGLNFASIHTTSNTFTRVFYRLLANPQYLSPLRHEVETVIAQEGWTKAGMDKMHKLDSFVRESQRLDGLLISGMTRLALRPFTFSNGVTVPAGTLVALPQAAIHTDGDIYANSDQFDGFRFSKVRDTEGNAAETGYLATATSGRFFAVNEIKALLAHIITSYDFKFEEGKGVPPERRMGSQRITPNVDLLFRKRQK
ncbi:cytochrome P450 [Russula compacta]|nr:cytochrome P450 [Russula compacta]